ncbi:MAG: flagellar biosynthesis protein [Bdellovibrionales bacterium]|jgi:flagellar operon protein|nr:flagellar biosynthesis protein [Bdellovibrionales bacterium]MBT3527418.1 flagellar biosynthesis protein [Bdellovibrionales bacterium]MBT7670472.1 flagellar biosynthesis protein [Bdellovibrionales bacterium]MBT7767869.1 flagellar biosynthesis protein [Bdellovibrionales bacterium]
MNADVSKILNSKVAGSNPAGTASTHAKSKINNRDQELFDRLLKGEIQQGERTPEQHGVRLSQHAAKRLKERAIEMNSSEFYKLREAMDKLRSKGGQDSLVITPTAAYIVDVNNDMIVTAVDKGGLGESVFTKIDSTMVVD